MEGKIEDDCPVLDERGFARRKKLGPVRKVNCDCRIPVVADERVPPGMAVVGYDKDGKLVALVNIDKAEPG